MPQDGPSKRLRASQKRLVHAGRVVGIAERIEHADRIEALRTARTLAIAGLPKRRYPGRDLSRTLRVARDLWMRVTYSTRHGKELPFGEDRFVLAGIQHLAIEQNSPVILFDRVGALLKQFGLRESGDTLARLRHGFGRLAGLSVSLVFGRTQRALDEDAHGEQLFVIERYSLPTRNDLRSEHAGQLAIPELHPFGVVLGDRFWRHLSEYSNHLLVPLELLKLFIDRPTGWDYLCFLVARCGAAKRSSKVPHEALISLFRDTERQTDRDIIRALQRYHTEILRATGGRLNAELVEDGAFPSSGGRPKKRWALIVRPSQSLFERPATLIEG